MKRREIEGIYQMLNRDSHQDGEIAGHPFYGETETPLSYEI